MLYTIEVRHKFSAAHQLPDTPTLFTKGCARLHGHGYHVRAILGANELQDGFVVDFKQVKDVINKLDHYNLNDILTVPTTAENISKYLFEQIDKAVNDSGRVRTMSVKLCEGYNGEELTSWVTYEPQPAIL